MCAPWVFGAQRSGPWCPWFHSIDFRLAVWTFENENEPAVHTRCSDLVFHTVLSHSVCESRYRDWQPWYNWVNVNTSSGLINSQFEFSVIRCQSQSVLCAVQCPLQDPQSGEGLSINLLHGDVCWQAGRLWMWRRHLPAWLGNLHCSGAPLYPGDVLALS